MEPQLTHSASTTALVLECIGDATPDDPVWRAGLIEWTGLSVATIRGVLHDSVERGWTRQTLGPKPRQGAPRRYLWLTDAGRQALRSLRGEETEGC